MGVVFSSTEDIVEFCSEKALHGVFLQQTVHVNAQFKVQKEILQVVPFQVAGSQLSECSSVKVPGIKRILSTYSQSVVKAQMFHLVFNSVTNMSKVVKIRLCEKVQHCA